MATTLAADVTISDNSVTLNSGHDPIAQGDSLLVDSEQMTVTGPGAADIFPVTRGASGTTPAAHTTGTAVTVTAAAPSICSRIASNSTVAPAGFIPVPTHVFLGTCADAASEPTWQEVSNVESINIPSPSITMLDVNNLANNSGVVLQIPGLSTPGDIQLICNYWPDDPTHDELTGLIHLSHTHEPRPWKIEDQYSDDRILRVTFVAYVTALPLQFQATAPMKLTATLRQLGGVDVDRVSLTDGSIIDTKRRNGGVNWKAIGRPVTAAA